MRGLEKRRDSGQLLLVWFRPIWPGGAMASWDWDKIWQGTMAVALPIGMGAAAADPTLKETFLGLWEDLTPARALFFLSLAIICVGFTRNSARLRQLRQRSVSELPHQKNPSQTFSGPRESMPPRSPSRPSSPDYL